MKKKLFRPAACLLLAAVLLCAACLGGCAGFGGGSGRSRIINIDPGSEDDGSGKPDGGSDDGGDEGSRPDDGGQGADYGDNAYSAAAASASYLTNECHPDSYVMDITLDTEAHTISGTCYMTLTNLSDGEIGYLDVRLYSGAITGLTSSYISDARNADTGRVYDYMPDVDGSLYAVRLGDDRMAPGETMTLRLEFVSQIPERDDRFGYHQDEAGTMYCLSFCFPQISLYHDGVWDEDPYYDDGETEVNVMSDYSVTLHAPASYVVAASGHQSTEDGVTSIEAPNIREMGIVCCDCMSAITEEVGGVTFHQYCPEYEGLDRFYENMLANAEAAVAVYSEHIGPYIYDELDVVPFHVGSCGSGMEMPGLIMNGLPAMAKTVGGTTAFTDLSYVDSAITTVHEAGHQWFYCAVGDDQYDEAWIDESFATFVSEYLYVLEWPEALDQAVRWDREEGRDAYTYLIDRNDPYRDIRAQAQGMAGMTATPYINWSVGDYRHDYDYTICVYYFGQYFLAELQHAMGDEAFYQMLQGYYSEANGQIAQGSCFIRHVLAADHSPAVLEVLERYVDPEALR